MASVTLVSRKLFGDDPDKPKTTCPIENTHGPKIVHFVGDYTFHQFATVLSGACAIVSILIISILITRHAFNYRHPVQQRQIIRILLLVPYVAFFSFLIVWRQEAGEYLVESLDLGCAMALAAFLLLLCDYVMQSPGGFDELFGEGAWQRGQFVGSSPIWLRRIWYGVLQFIPASIIIWVATAITLATGSYCTTSNSIHFAHIWLTVLKFVCTIISIASIFKFYGRQKQRLAPYNVFLKLFAFKGIIGLNVFQTFIINILTGQNVLNPSKYLAHNDISPGLPSLILACEMPLFAILLLFAFPVKEIQGEVPAAGPLSAIVDALNITDLLSAFVRGPMRLVREQQREIARQGSMKVSTALDEGVNRGYSGYRGQEYGVEGGYEGRYEGGRYGNAV